MPMCLNIRPDGDPVAIRLMRPLALAVRALEHEEIPRPAEPLTFSRAEWALLVASGLLYALGTDRGWQDWDKATAYRAEGVTDHDHLLIVASLFLRGYEFGQAHDYPPAMREAGLAIEALQRRAAEYREIEGVPAMVEPGPMPRIAHFHGGRLWFSNHDLPDPSHQAPILEHAVEGTHVDVLIDLAKQGEEATFKDLAQTLGVPAAKLDELWAGTVRRVRR